MVDKFVRNLSHGITDKKEFLDTGTFYILHFREISQPVKDPFKHLQRNIFGNPNNKMTITSASNHLQKYHLERGSTKA